MKLSILIPSIPERLSKTADLIAKLESQILDHKEVEILCLIDNMNMSLGDKRQRLFEMAAGKYFSFVDDDDDISPLYVSELLKAAEQGKDVITFRQITFINDEPFQVEFKLNNENEEAHKIDGVWADIKRKPFHVCAWKKSICRGCFFPDLNYNEDAFFVECAVKNAITETHINKVLHFYRFDSKLTRANNVR